MKPDEITPKLIEELRGVQDYLWKRCEQLYYSYSKNKWVLNTEFKHLKGGLILPDESELWDGLNAWVKCPGYITTYVSEYEFIIYLFDNGEQVLKSRDTSRYLALLKAWKWAQEQMKGEGND
jgi:hypothetical protein